MRRHLLVTNDFPPKVGGIQSYLWELWRRLPSDDFAVYTTPYSGTMEFDRNQDFTLERSREPFLLPYPWLPSRINRIARRNDVDLVVWDPAVPLGMIAPYVERPYAVVLHGAEVTVPARLPIARSFLGRVLDRASLVICAGGYPAAEAERTAGRSLPIVVIPPGVDTGRFVPLDKVERASTRTELGLPVNAPVVVAVTRLVPRKGIDTLIRAGGLLRTLFPDLVMAIAGTGRDERRLRELAQQSGATVRLFGRIPDNLLPGFLGSGDVFAMPCRSRWWGLEQEGFGIVFVEAAAVGIPQVAGKSGGSAEAVVHGETGLVVDVPADPAQVAEAIATLLGDDQRRVAMGQTARNRAVLNFSYDVLAERLLNAIDEAKLR